LVALALAAPATAATITVTTSADGAVTAPANGLCTLREAITAANTNAAVDGCPAGSASATDTVVIPSGFYIKLTHTGSNEENAVTGDLDITGSTVVAGGGQLTTAVSGNLSDRVFDVQLDASVRISGLRIENGQVSDADGGGILSRRAALTLTNVLITRNSVNAGGGFGLVTGGGVHNAGGSLTISGSSISGNSAAAGSGQGGGVGQSLFFGTPVLNITNSVIAGNTAGTEGGGIHSGFGDVDLANVVVAANTASGNGGGFVFRAPLGGALNVSNVLFQENRGSHGGAIWLNTGNLVTLRGVKLLKNQATAGAGGGLHLTQAGTGSKTVSEASISGNTATGSGGGVFLGGTGSGSVAISRTTINDNVSVDGDGIQNSVTGGGTVTIANSTISRNGNTAAGNGGGINHASGSTLVLANVTLNENAAGISGAGGHIFKTGAITVRNSIAANVVNGGNCQGSGVLTQGGRNLEQPIGASPCGFAVTGFPLLDPLADNGGATQTHALQAGSAAINQGIGCETIDQRGVPRPSACDIGAYERVLCAGGVVNRVGTQGANRMTGTNASEVFLMLGGNDVLNPGRGTDRACMGAGNDTVRARDGRRDILRGEGGTRDRLATRDSTDSFTGFERFG
jgi:CSLREA domain-containing protein